MSGAMLPQAGPPNESDTPKGEKGHSDHSGGPDNGAGHRLPLISFELFHASIFFQLPSYVLPNLFFIKAYGAHTVSFCPKVSAPIPFLEFKVPVENPEPIFRTPHDMVFALPDRMCQLFRVIH